jgi:DNA-binding MarR family transcriptional regulator
MRPRTDPPAPDAPVDLPCACATVRRAARMVTQLYDGHLRAAEIEGTQFALLSVLSSLSPCNQAAIGERIALDKTTLSRNLKLLKNKGWIEEAEAADGRERRYVLTVAGRKRLAVARPAWQRAQRHLRASMGARDWNAMWKVFRTLTTAAHTARRGMPAGSTK